MQAVVGAGLPRPDGRAKVTGDARFVDDITLPGMWHGATIRSPHPAARILRVHTDVGACDSDVVTATADDLPGPNVVKLIADDWPILARDYVNHIGEAVALVAAPTRGRALDAARAIHVEYDPLPAVLTLDDALRGDPRAGGTIRVLAECAVDHGDVEKGLANADVVIEGTYETGHQEHIYIEPQGVIAIPQEDGGIEIIGSMQCPYYVHAAIVHMLGVPPKSVRVRQSVTGGGFGGKEDYPSLIAAHAVLLARKIGRPVKIIYDRHEDIVATTKRHPSRVRHRTGVTRDGKLVAMDIDVLLDGGAYTTLSPVVLSRGVLHASGPYRCPNVRVLGRVLATNTATNGAFRGFGAPQTIFAVERQMDRIARVLGLDPATVRERNAYRVGDTTPTGQVLTASVAAHECLRAATERADFHRRWRSYEAARAERDPHDPSPMRGVGLSLYWHGSGFTGNGERRMLSPAAVCLLPGGRVEVLTASTDIGQGTIGVFAQMVADSIGIPAEDVVIADPDTARVPDSGPTVASRTVMVVGGVLTVAARALRDTLSADLARRAGCDAGAVRITNGRFVGPDGRDLGSFADVGDAYLAAHGELRCERRYEPPAGESFDDRTYRGAAYSAYGWGCDVIEVEVDPITLACRPVHATVACDVGRAINPTLCSGQIEGGTLQAIAWAHLEEMKLKDGRYVNDRMQTYLIPTAADAPDIDTILIEEPYPHGPFGAKGIGELPMDGGAPATVAAIENAAGVFPVSIPVTPEKLLDAFAGGRAIADLQDEDRAPW
jgi:CO/xanthine dehydrogenase Mo-binding subunit